MSLNLVYDGAPLGTTTTGTAGAVATSTTGLWDTAATGTQGAWSDLVGGVYSNSGGYFQGYDSSGQGFTTSFALRPTAEDALNHAITGYFPANLTGANNGLAVRFQRSNENCYLVNWVRSSSYVAIYSVVAGAATLLDSPSVAPAAYNSAHAYSLNFAASGSSPTTLTITLLDLTAGTTLLSYSMQDSTPSLQSAGAVGLDSWGGISTFSRVQTYSGSSSPSPTLIVNPSTASVVDGGSPQSITATLANSSASLAATVTGGGAISTSAPTSGTAFTYTPPSSGSGTATVTVTDATDSLTATCTITYGASSLTVGPLTLVASSPSGITLATAISGGSTPYSTQLYRSTTSGFTPGSGNAVGSPVVGANPSLVDTTAVAGTVYFYAATVTGGGSATTGQFAASLEAAPVKVGLIGDSLLDPSQGSTEGLSFWTGTAIQQYLGQVAGTRQATVIDRGVGGQDSGNWAVGGSLFGPALAAITAAGCTHVLIQIGTNDVRTPANSYSAGHRPLGTPTDGTTPGPAGSYAVNMTGIINAVLAAGLKVVLPGVSYFYPTTSFSGVVWDNASLNLAQTYNAWLGSLVNGTTIFGPVGQTFAYFANNQSEYYHENGATTNGVHPNATGVNSYGVILGSALATALGLIGGSGSSSSVTDSSVQADVTAALVAIGYTSTRAAKLDYLDAAVSSRSTYAGGPVASVTAPVALPSNAPSGFLANVGGFGPWSLPQTIRAIAVILFGKRSNVPPPNMGGVVAYQDDAGVAYGSVTYDSAGNISAQNLTPPA